MLAVDRPEFDTAVTRLMGVYNRSPDQEQRDIWWAALRKYDFKAVRMAMLEYTQEKQHAPTPAAIRGLVRNASPEAGGGSEPSRQTHWTAVDLICACNFAAIDWSPPRFGRVSEFRGDWVARVAMAYDDGLADAAQRIVGKRPELSPADAAREFVKGYGRPWFLPLTREVAI